MRTFLLTLLVIFGLTFNAVALTMVKERYVVQQNPVVVTQPSSQVTVEWGYRVTYPVYPATPPMFWYPGYPFAPSPYSFFPYDGWYIWW